MTRTRTATTRTIARALGAALLVAACAAPGPAGAQTAWQQLCIDAWDDAPAELYCSAGVARVGAASDGSTGHCYVSRISCSINVTVAITGGEAAGSYTASRYSMTQTPEDTEDITLCFAIDDDAWEMNLNVGACGSGEIDLDTARSTGLPLIETESADGDGS
jgi:hypothetical protein